MKYYKYGHNKWHRSFEWIINKQGILCYDFEKCTVAGLRSNGNYEHGVFDKESLFNPPYTEKIGNKTITYLVRPNEIHWKGLINFKDERTTAF